MVEYIAKYKLSDRVYIAELEQNGRDILAVVHENDKGEIVRIKTFEGTSKREHRENAKEQTIFTIFDLYGDSYHNAIFNVCEEMNSATNAGYFIGRDDSILFNIACRFNVLFDKDGNIYR